MIRTFTMCCALLLATAAHASKPEYFTDEIDNEYRSLMKQVTALLPKTDLPLVYLPAFTPFNLLDIHPTKFDSLTSCHDLQRVSLHTNAY